jgi:hypothetical protein
MAALRERPVSSIDRPVLVARRSEVVSGRLERARLQPCRLVAKNDAGFSP